MKYKAENREEILKTPRKDHKIALRFFFGARNKSDFKCEDNHRTPHRCTEKVEILKLWNEIWAPGRGGLWSAEMTYMESWGLSQRAGNAFCLATLALFLFLVFGVDVRAGSLPVFAFIYVFVQTGGGISCGWNGSIKVAQNGAHWLNI